MTDFYREWEQLYATRAQMLVNDLRAHKAALEDFAARVPEPHKKHFSALAARIDAVMACHFGDYQIHSKEGMAVRS